MTGRPVPTYYFAVRQEPGGLQEPERGPSSPSPKKLRTMNAALTTSHTTTVTTDELAELEGHEPSDGR